MKLSTPSTTFFLAALAGFASTANATCHVYMYQVGSNSAQDLYLQSFNHDDTSCMADYESSDLKEGEWISVEANKDHESTIQVQIADRDVDCGNSIACGIDFKSCDGIFQSTGECGAVKATCWEHYIIYVEDDNLICEAATDSSGNVVTNSSGDPYCADSSTSSTDSNDDSDCKSLSFEDIDQDLSRRTLLRGAH